MKKIFKWVAVICILGIVIWFRSEYTWVDKNRIINFALTGNRQFKIYKVAVDYENKRAEYVIYPYRKAATDNYISIWKRLNKYLADHEDYFLNDGYAISLEFVGTKSGGPSEVYFRNWNSSWRKEHENTSVSNFLGNMTIKEGPESGTGFDLVEIKSSEATKGITSIIIGEINDYVLIKDITVFGLFTDLSYLEINVPLQEEKKEELIRVLPECEVYFGK